MNYTEYIKELLSPLGVYDLNEGAGAGEIEALGETLDVIDDFLSELEREMVCTTAESYGLDRYESMLPYEPVYEDASGRRAALAALLQIDDTSFTKEALNKSLAGCGISAKVYETDEKYLVKVTFPDNRGIPDNIEALKKRIEEILPCHLDVLYVYTYPTWEEILLMGTWGDIESRGTTWDEFERFKPQ